MEEDPNDAANQSFSSIEGLEDLTWDGLLDVCKEKNEQLNLAGACGLKLHEQLMESQAHIDDMRIQHDTEIERLHQEIFEIRSRLECKEKALVCQESDFDEYQKQAMRKHERQLEEIQEAMKKEIRTMKKEKDSTMADLEQVQLREQQANEQIVVLEKRVHVLHTESTQKMKVEAGNVDKELAGCLEKISLLEELNTELTAKLNDIQHVNQALELELSTKTKACNEFTKELEEIEIRSTTYFNHLQQAREEKTEIKAELDMLLEEQRNSGHKKSGNSLFSEVEDRRVEMEKKLLSMQVKYESLLKAYNFVKNQLHNMKTQVYALLQVKNARADEDHISRLQRALSQAKAENMSMSTKLKMTEEKQNLSKENIRVLAQNLPEFKRSQDLVDFLYAQIEDYKSKMAKLQKDFDQIYMVKLAESDKLHKAEERLYESTVQAESYNQANMRLRLKLEETKNMLQAETQKLKLVEKKFDYDSSADIVPIGVINETKKVEKQPLPYTLIKAKQKEDAKFKSMNNRSTSISNKTNNCSSMTSKDALLNAGMHKLPKEILDQLGLSNLLLSSNSSATTTNTTSTPTKTTATEVVADENLPTKIVNGDKMDGSKEGDGGISKPRRVSFKETPELISLTDKVANVNQPLACSTMIEDDVIVTNAPGHHLTPLSTLKSSSKSKTKAPLKDSSNVDKPVIAEVKKQNVVTASSGDTTEEADCKVQ